MATEGTLKKMAGDDLKARFCELTGRQEATDNGGRPLGKQELVDAILDLQDGNSTFINGEEVPPLAQPDTAFGAGDEEPETQPDYVPEDQAPEVSDAPEGEPDASYFKADQTDPQGDLSEADETESLSDEVADEGERPAPTFEYGAVKSSSGRVKLTESILSAARNFTGTFKAAQVAEYVNKWLQDNGEDVVKPAYVGAYLQYFIRQGKVAKVGRGADADWSLVEADEAQADA